MINTAPGCHVVKLSRCKGQFSVNLRVHENKVIKSAKTQDCGNFLYVCLIHLALSWFAWVSCAGFCELNKCSCGWKIPSWVRLHNMGPYGAISQFYFSHVTHFLSVSIFIIFLKKARWGKNSENQFWRSKLLSRVVYFVGHTGSAQKYSRRHPALGPANDPQLESATVSFLHAENIPKPCT